MEAVQVLWRGVIHDLRYCMYHLVKDVGQLVILLFRTKTQEASDFKLIKPTTNRIQARLKAKLQTPTEIKCVTSNLKLG